MKNKIPTIKIKEHSYYTVKMFSRTQAYYAGVSADRACRYCDCREGTQSSTFECKEREILDPLFGLTQEEYDFLVTWLNYKIDLKTGRWNKPYESETFTTLQLKKIFSNRVVEMA